MRKFLAAALFALLLVSRPTWPQTEVSMGKPDIIEVIDIQGEIGEFTATAIAGTVEKINDNKQVKGVLLIVNSPGGGAVASSNVYEELSKIKVPVVAWCSSVCASGGLYVMMAPSVKYVALRNESISGSVGVVMNVTRFHRLLEWAKIDNETFKSGVLKDAGNPTREMSSADRKYLQSIIDELAERFYAVVAKSRTIKDWNAVKSARIFIGKQAVDVGLADGVMTRDQAVRKVKELSGSKLIFTRDEMKKISTMAHDPGYEVPQTEPKYLTDISFLVDMLKEIKAGESVTIEYKMPYKF